ncbi:PDDEXK family nuclease [Delftia tsuruhatensis]
MLAFEIDVGGHKLDRSKDRDLALVSAGWTILRFRADHARSAEYFTKAFRIAEKLVPGFQCPSEFPATTRSQYRVVIRCPEFPAGLSVNDPNDPAITELRTRREHGHPTTTVG